MGIDRYFLKSEGHRKLIEAIFIDGLEASAYELSRLSGLGYSSTYYELGTLADLGTVVSRKESYSILFKSCLDAQTTSALRSLLGFSSHPPHSEKLEDHQIKAALAAKGAPLVSEKAVLPPEISLGELFARSAVVAKKDAAVARALPVALYKNRFDLDASELVFWSKKLKAKQEVGFFLSLVAELSGDKRFSRIANLLRDKRVKTSKDFFTLSTPSQRQLAETRTPVLARKWKLRMNMSMESFKSTFDKFSEGA